jgi:hypothetical protein
VLLPYEAGCSVEEVHAVLDRHPITVDRDKYLKRALAMQLLQLDQLEVAFREKAFEDHDVASGMLLVGSQAKADWRFTTDAARIKLKRVYPAF